MEMDRERERRELQQQQWQKEEEEEEEVEETEGQKEEEEEEEVHETEGQKVEEEEEEEREVEETEGQKEEEEEEEVEETEGQKEEEEEEEEEVEETEGQKEKEEKEREVEETEGQKEEEEVEETEGQKEDEEEEEVEETGGQKEEEEEEEVEETEEHVVEAEALQGRRPRHPTTTAAAIDANDSISNGEVMLLSEPANEFQEQEYRQEELQNGSEISNEVEVESQERAEKNVYYDQDEGTESIYGFSITENGDIQDSAFEKNPGEDGLIVALKNFDSQQSQNTVVNQYKENLKDNNLSSCRLLPLDKSSEECRANKSFSDITDAHDEIELIKEIDQEFTELDVERVLEKQDTHDLYCPNCNSCITRRVILCKRKRKIRISGEDAKRNKLETGVASESHAISDHVTNNQGCSAADILLDANLTPAADDYNRGREPEIFKCLSCFSFFIPTGDGFKLFKIFGNKSENENMQHPQPISVSKKNWFSSIFASHKEEISIEQGIGSKAGVEENIVGVSKQEVTSPQPFVARELVKKSTAEHQEEAVDIHWNAPLKADKDATSQLIQDALLIQDGQINITQDLKDLPAKSSTGIGLEAGDREGGEDFEPSSTQGSKLHTEEPTENVIYKPQQDELKILVHSSTESITIEKSQIDHKPNVEIERKSAGIVYDKDALTSVQKPKLGMLTSLHNNYIKSSCIISTSAYLYLLK
ncbi:hypothetical protein U1Q18_047607 [Sarracenia purpurea var. burkii]